MGERSASPVTAAPCDCAAPLCHSHDIQATLVFKVWNSHYSLCFESSHTRWNTPWAVVSAHRHDSSPPILVVCCCNNITTFCNGSVGIKTVCMDNR